MIASSEEKGSNAPGSPQLIPESEESEERGTGGETGTGGERAGGAERAAKFTRDHLGGHLGSGGLGGATLASAAGGVGADGDGVGGEGGLGEGGQAEAAEAAQARRTSVTLNSRAYREETHAEAPPHLYVQARHPTSPISPHSSPPPYLPDRSP